MDTDPGSDTANGWRRHWRALAIDRQRYRALGHSTWAGAGFWSVVMYRLQNMAREARPDWLFMPARMLLGVLWRFLALATGIHISAEAEIGPGLVVPHPGAVWVTDRTKIGARCTIFHGCTIGGSGPDDATGTIIGDDVMLSCQSTIIGKVAIGDGATIAANTLVITDVPAGATAIGVPAKFLPVRAAPAKPAA